MRLFKNIVTGGLARQTCLLMSTVFVSVGQCGNQVGYSFWETVLNWNKTEEKRIKKPAKDGFHQGFHTPFMKRNGNIPWIMVDSERKVVTGCLSKQIAQLVPAANRLSHRKGYGGNWALGYCEQKKEGSLMEQTLECLRKETERLDVFSGTVLFHSLAGGTGSGFGSHLVEQLREEYPLAYILSLAVAPFHTGETPLQHYNSLLCLSWLQKYTDGVLLFSNDNVLTSLQKISKSPSKAISFNDLNYYIANTTATTFLPIYDGRKQQRSKVSIGKEVWDIVQSTCPNPEMKFLTPLYSRGHKVSTSWDQLVHSITSNSVLTKRFRYNDETIFPVTNSLLLTARGSSTSITQLEQSLKSVETNLVSNPASWNPFPIDARLSHEPLLMDKKYLSVCANNSSVIDYLNSVCNKARLMYDAGAYLHWYSRYACDKDCFKEALEQMEQTIQCYMCK